MPKYVYKEAVYPQTHINYRAVTPTGTIGGIFDTAEKAHDFIKRFKHAGWKVVMVTELLEEVPVSFVQTKSSIIRAIAEEQGLTVIDVPLSA